MVTQQAQKKDLSWVHPQPGGLVFNSGCQSWWMDPKTKKNTFISPNPMYKYRLRTIFPTWSDFKIVRKGDFGPQSPTFTSIALIGLVAAAGLWTTFLTASSVEGSGAISNIFGQAKSMMKLVTA
jgi:hypothetical protein